MNSWNEINRLSQQMICLEAIHSLEELLNLDIINGLEFKLFRQSYKDNYNKEQILSGYTVMKISLSQKLISPKFLISWPELKFESIEYWLSAIKNDYIQPHEKDIYQELSLFQGKFKNSFPFLSTQLVMNKKNSNTIIITKSSELHDTLLGADFDNELNYYKLNFSLSHKNIKEEIRKI